MTRNCQTCGADLGPGFAQARMANCSHCGTSHILRDKVFEAAGQAGVLHEAPGLLRLGQRVQTPHGVFLPQGLVRFSYGRGSWDEFWVTDAEGKGAWLSVDEGDLALQWPVPSTDLPKRPPALGALLPGNWQVTEAEGAQCLGLAGFLPEVITPGASFLFVNASDGEGNILSGEFSSGVAEGGAWFAGPWIDPFDVRPAP